MRPEITSTKLQTIYKFQYTNKDKLPLFVIWNFRASGIASALMRLAMTTIEIDAFGQQALNMY